MNKHYFNAVLSNAANSFSQDMIKVIEDFYQSEPDEAKLNQYKEQFDKIVDQYGKNISKLAGVPYWDDGELGNILEAANAAKDLMDGLLSVDQISNTTKRFVYLVEQAYDHMSDVTVSISQMKKIHENLLN